ncbi:hypothetical protein JCM6882_008269 [Rhodosporidiobolus microsporus]
MAAKSAIYLAALAAAAQSVAGHAIVTSVWVNGEDTADAGVGVGSSYMRTPSSNSPVKDLTSPTFACNDRGTSKVTGYLTVAAGDVIEPEWWHSGGRGDDPIATSHVGPITTWISPLDANTEGDVWVQISSEAWYEDKKSAVDKMIANKGRNTVTVPSTLAPGDYLFRFDLLALHEGDRVGGAQFYPNCAQITVTGSGKQELPAGVAIPGFITQDTPGVFFNMYTNPDDVLKYVAPGTGVWDGSASYSTETCDEVVYGIAPAGYCQAGGSSKPVTTSKAATTTTSKAPSTTATSKAATSTSQAAPTTSAVATSKPAVSSPVAAPTSAVATTSQAASSSAAATTSKAATTSAAQQSSTTSKAPSTTSSAPDSSYTDYNSCMRAYNKCLDKHQPKSGGAADFSECYSTFQCSNLRMKRSTRPKQLHGRDRVVRLTH